MAPIYNYLTFSEAVMALANRLYDPTQQFWSNTEMVLLIQDALSTWQALTGYWRADFTFRTQTGIYWYDLTTLPNTLRPLTTLDTQLYTFMEYQLLEPTTGVNPWTGSTQFSAVDLVKAVQRRRDELLSICAPFVTRRLVAAVAGRIQLPDTVIDVRRIAYLPSSISGQPNSILWADDTWAEQSFNRLYTIEPAGTPGTPSTYLLSTQPPISFDVDVPPTWAGQYELLTNEAGPLLLATTPQGFTIPDDWMHVVRWGALADLLSRESDAKDVARAAYCEQRYRLGMAALTVAPALLALRIDNVGIQIDSVRAADLYTTGWESAANGTPFTALYAGMNLLALSPPPDSNPASSLGYYTLTASVVQNAPLPMVPTDLVQMAREDFDAIIDYAQHVATWKQGGQEFADTMPLLGRFLKAAAHYNGRLSELGEFTSTLAGISSREDAMNPRATPDAQTAVTS